MTHLKNNIGYFCAYLLLLVAMIVALWVCPKGELHLALNAYHSPLLDQLMRAITYLAQWPLYALMALFFFRHWRFALYYAGSEIAAAVITRIIKLSVNMPRPAAFFGDNAAFQQIVVDGVQLHQWHSFPSGHTQTFFVCATALVLFMNSDGSPWPLNSPSVRLLLSLLLLAMAALGGYSRIYLSQHFLLDVCVGSLIGVMVPLLLFPLYKRCNTTNNALRNI